MFPGNGVPRGVVSGLGNLPFPLPDPRGIAAPSRDYRPGESPAEQAAKAWAEIQAAALRRVSGSMILNVQPSPLEAPPFRGKVEELFARVMIAPPTSPGDSDATTGAANSASAEAKISGKTISVLTPATTSDWVTALSFEVPAGRACVVYSVGTWGHDLLAVRDAITWRVMGGGTVLASARELGLLGSVDHPVLIHAVLREKETLTIEAQNKDAHSGSLVEVRVLAWTFPPAKAGGDYFEALLGGTGSGAGAQ